MWPCGYVAMWLSFPTILLFVCISILLVCHISEICYLRRDFHYIFSTCNLRNVICMCFCDSVMGHILYNVLSRRVQSEFRFTPRSWHLKWLMHFAHIFSTCNIWGFILYERWCLKTGRCDFTNCIGGHVRQTSSLCTGRPWNRKATFPAINVALHICARTLYARGIFKK